MSIGKIFQTMSKHVDVGDVSKLAKSSSVKGAAADAVTDIGEALAGQVTKRSSDIASTIIEETAEAGTKKAGKQGFFARFWNKLTKSKGSSQTVSSSSSSPYRAAVESTDDELREQIAKLQKQLTTEQAQHKKDVKKLTKKYKSLSSETSALKKETNAFKQNTTSAQQAQVEVDCMPLWKKFISPKCSFSWSEFRWIAN